MRSQTVRWPLVEIALVLVTALVFLALPKPPAAILPIALFIPCCIAGWAAFFVWRVRAEPALIERWGLHPLRDLAPLCQILAPVLGILVLIGAGIALVRDKPLLPEYLAVSLLLYPLWGLVQQWLVQALLVDNVRTLTNARLPARMLLGAVGFGAIHLEHPLLVLATAGMGGLYVALFARWRNLWPLAVCHGVLGSLFYPWVLDLNPAADMIALLCTRLG